MPKRFSFFVERMDYMSTVASHIENLQSAVYWKILKNLSENVKLDLISRLSLSLLKTPVEELQEDWTAEFAGAWKDERSAEDMIADIRNSRSKNRDIEL